MNDSETIKPMIEKAESKLKTALIDFENGQYDDSVSRSYYAIFHAISAALFSKGLSFSSHGQTIGAFNREFIKTGIFPREYMLAVQKLFDERQTGDYDIFSEIDRDTACECAEDARKLIDGIKKYLNL